MDRICLSVAILLIAAEQGWAEGMQGIIQGAFLWGYLATQLLGGTLADKFGGKLVMGAGILWFSLASALLPAIAVTPWAAKAGIVLPMVLAARFLVGFGEGVALPAMNSLFAKTIPATRRATALGMAFTGFHSGNLVGLVLSPIILATLGWRALFYAFGLLGIPLLLIWSFVVPSNSGGDSSSMSSKSSSSSSVVGEVVYETDAFGGLKQMGETAVIHKSTSTTSTSVSISRFLSEPATWAIIIANIVNHWGYFIYLNWMPTYFYKVLGMNLRASSYSSLLPWIAMAIGSSAAGIVADTLVTKFGISRLTVRRFMQTVAFLGPVGALMILTQPGISAATAIACMTAALGITSLGQAGFVANMGDIAPANAGKLFGLCNTFGCLAGIFGVTGAGMIVEKTGSFTAVFQITAWLYVVGTVVWNLLCSTDEFKD